MRPSTARERRRLYLLARLLVARHYRRALTLHAVASALCCSPRQLQRVYAQFGDLTFQEDLRARRLAAAAELLAGQAIPVCDIARLVGYHHSSHIVRMFRRRRGARRDRIRAVGKRQRFRAGQAHAHQCSPCARALYRDRAAVLLDDLAHDRQAQPRTGPSARLRAAVEAVEDVRPVVLGDARSVVAHRQLTARQLDLDRRVGGAVLQRVVEQIVHRPPETPGRARQHRRRQSRAQFALGRASACARERLADEHVQAHVLGFEVPRGLLAAGEIDQVVDQRRQLLDPVDHLAQQLLALARVDIRLLLQNFNVRTQARHRRAQLVRSVGHQLALGVHRRVQRADRALQRIEHRVEAHRQPANLIRAPRTLDAARKIARARHMLGRACQATHRRDHCSRHQPPEQRRQRDPTKRDRDQDQPQTGQRLVDFGQRLCQLCRHTRVHGLGEDPQVDAVDPRVREERATTVPRQRPRARAHRQCDPRRARPHQHPAARAHQLLVAAHLVGSRRESAQRVGAQRRREQSPALAPAWSVGCEKAPARGMGRDEAHLSRAVE
jgi:AraC-like DNA-binding protein